MNKRIVEVAVLVLSMIILVRVSYYKEKEYIITHFLEDVEIEGLYDLSSLVWDLSPELYRLDRFEILIETQANGSVRHHFVERKESESIYTEHYIATAGTYISLTDKSYHIPYTTYDYGDMLGSCATISRNKDYVPDYRMRYQIVSHHSIILPAGYALHREYKRSEIKRLERQLDAEFVKSREDLFIKKYFYRKYNVYNLYIICANGRVIVCDTGEVVETTEYAHAKRPEEIRRTLYLYDILDPGIAIKVNSSKTKFEETLDNTYYGMVENSNYDMEGITGMSEKMSFQLNSGIRTDLSVFDYLTEEQMENSVITGSELLEILKEIQKSNTYRFL